MADEKSEEQVQDAPLPAKAVTAAQAFVTAHGIPTRAVLENMGRPGIRVVLVGKDGAMGDVIVPTEAAGVALAEQVEGLELSEWDRETVAATSIGSAHRRKMSNRGGG